MKSVLTLLAAAVCVGCSQDVTQAPAADKPPSEPSAVSIALNPDADEYVYELIIEERSIGTETVMSILEAEIKVKAIRFDTGRVRLEFEVTRAKATSGPTRERQSPDPKRAASLRSLRWTSKHDATGRIVDFAAEADPERVLDMLGAGRGLFGLEYPSDPVRAGTPWRTRHPGAEWRLASAADWLGTLEGTVSTPAAPDSPEQSRSVRARIQLNTGMPIEMVGDEALSPRDSKWDSILRHWTLSLIG